MGPSSPSQTCAPRSLLSLNKAVYCGAGNFCMVHRCATEEKKIRVWEVRMTKLGFLSCERKTRGTHRCDHSK